MILMILCPLNMSEFLKVWGNFPSSGEKYLNKISSSYNTRSHLSNMVVVELFSTQFKCNYVLYNIK